MQMTCIKCGIKKRASPNNLRKNHTTEDNYMCINCSIRYKHYKGSKDKETRRILEYWAYLFSIKGEQNV